MLFSSPVMCLFFLLLFLPDLTLHAMPDRVYLRWKLSGSHGRRNEAGQVLLRAYSFPLNYNIKRADRVFCSLYLCWCVLSLAYIQGERTKKLIIPTKSSPLYLSLYVVPPTSISSFTSSMGAAYTYNKTKKCCVHGKWEGEEGALER